MRILQQVRSKNTSYVVHFGGLLSQLDSLLALKHRNVNVDIIRIPPPKSSTSFTVTCLTSDLLFKGTAWFNIALIGTPLTVSCYSTCKTIVGIAG